MKITFADLNPDLCNAMSAAFGNDISVTRYSILEVDAEVLVSPANSFGFMDGGIDGVYTNFFGRGLQERLQEKIQRDFNGELIVGQCTDVEIKEIESGATSYSALLSVPTMRVPMLLAHTPNVYLAASAMFRWFRMSSRYESIAFPGLGTLTGQVSPGEFARVVRLAYDHHWNGKYEFPKTLGDACQMHLETLTN